jgi:hypothetical protein
MSILIIPMAGKSSRFPHTKPKWMLTHPSTKNFVGVESIKGLNLNIFDKIYFITLEKYENQFSFLKGFKQCLKVNNLYDNSEIVLLPRATKSQPDTVAKVFDKHKKDTSFLIKDSDNYIDMENESIFNSVGYFDLNDLNLTNPSSKSYLQLDSEKNIINIVEKKVISNIFSIGAYGFNSSKEFTSNLDEIKNNRSLDKRNEIYTSHIIYNMILKGSIFKGIKATQFIDWGDISSWERFKNDYSTIFCDIDGTLVKNSSENFPPYIGQAEPLNENIKALNKLKHEKKAYIVLTTSRKEKHRELTIKEMKKHKVLFDKLIMDLPHSKRIIINDFSSSNSYPTSEAINIKRDEDKLNEYLKIEKD